MCTFRDTFDWWDAWDCPRSTAWQWVATNADGRAYVKGRHLGPWCREASVPSDCLLLPLPCNLYSKGPRYNICYTWHKSDDTMDRMLACGLCQWKGLLYSNLPWFVCLDNRLASRTMMRRLFFVVISPISLSGFESRMLLFFAGEIFIVSIGFAFMFTAPGARRP